MKDDLEKQIEELKQRLKIIKAIEKVKLFWPGDHLTDKEQAAVCKVSDKYLGEGNSLGVLFACMNYKSNPDLKPKKTEGRGRPKNSKDYPVKKLINQLGSYQKSGHTEQPSCMRLQEVFRHGKTFRQRIQN